MEQFVPEHVDEFIWGVIQGVTGPHRQKDGDDRSCREDHFFVKEHVLANMSFMSHAQVKVFARKGRN